MKRWMWAVLGGVLWAAAATAAESPTLSVTPPGVAPFPEQTVRLDLVVCHPTGGPATVNWDYTAATAFMSRGQHSFTAEPNRPHTVTIEFKTPPLVPHTMVNSAIRAEFRADNGTEIWAKIYYPIPLFGENPFILQRARLEEMRLVLFDPEGATRTALTEAKVPFRQATSLEAALAMNPGLLIFGEGVSLRQYRPWADWTAQAAARQVPTLILAPAEGHASLPLQGEAAANMRRMRMEDAHFVTTLNKRFTPEAWGDAALPVRGGWRMTSPRAGEVEATFDSSPPGAWAWMEWESAEGTRVALCAYDIIGRWDRAPASRWMLWRLMEHLTEKISGPRPEEGEPQ
jgi:hypothetical protein